MEFFSLEVILRVSHITFNENIIFCYLNLFYPTLIFALSITSMSTAYMGLHPDGDPSGGVLKDEGSPTLDARSQPIMGYTLMAAQTGQPPIWVFILTPTLRGVS